MIPTIYIIYGLIVVVLVLAFFIIRLEMRFKKIFVGKKGGDLEDSINALIKGVEMLHATQEDAEKEVDAIKLQLKKTIRNVEMVRFNPFADQGSNQSFAIAFLNDDGDGVVVSSLYSRERMSIFAKPIKKANSEFELSKEEKEVISKSSER